MATEVSAPVREVREVPTYRVHEMAPRRTRYAVLIPVIDEGRRLLDQLTRMEFLGGQGDIIVGDGGSTDSSGDPSVLRCFPVRTLLVKTGPGKFSAQLRMLLDYGLDEGYEEGSMAESVGRASESSGNSRLNRWQ